MPRAFVEYRIAGQMYKRRKYALFFDHCPAISDVSYLRCLGAGSQKRLEHHSIHNVHYAYSDLEHAKAFSKRSSLAQPTLHTLRKRCFAPRNYYKTVRSATHYYSVCQHNGVPVERNEMMHRQRSSSPVHDIFILEHLYRMVTIQPTEHDHTIAIIYLLIAMDDVYSICSGRTHRVQGKRSILRYQAERIVVFIFTEQRSQRVTVSFGNITQRAVGIYNMTQLSTNIFVPRAINVQAKNLSSVPNVKRK